MRISGSRYTYNFVSSESGITLLLLNWKTIFNYFMVTEKRLFKACNIKIEKVVNWILVKFTSQKNSKELGKHMQNQLKPHWSDDLLHSQYVVQSLPHQGLNPACL